MLNLPSLPLEHIKSVPNTQAQSVQSEHSSTHLDYNMAVIRILQEKTNNNIFQKVLFYDFTDLKSF